MKIRIACVQKIYFMILLGLCQESILWAQDNQFLANRRSILPGSRASQMGGAYTALGEDVSGLFYNPAGMVFGKPSNLSVSTNGYSERRLKYKGTIGESDFDEKSTGLFPSIIGGSLEWKLVSIGWSLVTLDSQSFNQNDRFDEISTEVNQASEFNITHQQTSQYQLAGAGGALLLGKSLSIGSSLFAYRRTLESTTHQMVNFNGGRVLFVDQKIDTENIGWMYQFGSQWRGKNISIGLLYRDYISLKNNTLVTTDTFTFIDGDTPTGTVESGQGVTQVFDELNPQTVKIGVAYFVPGWTISSDILYYSAEENVVTETLRVKLLETFNYSIGTELVMGPLVARLGAFTNNSHFPKVKDGGVDQAHHIDYIGASVGMGLRLKDSETNIGIVFQKGEGEAQKIQGTLSIQEVEASSMLLMLGTDYKF